MTWRPSSSTLLAIAFAAATTLGATQTQAASKPAASKAQLGGGAFCETIKDVAREKRYALKTKELNVLKAAIEERIEALAKKRSEFEEWRAKRDSFSQKAQDHLVEVYAKMRPDAAASRLQVLDKVLAAAILMKLPASKASVIFNEMKVEDAADITQIIAASGRAETKG